MDLNTFKNFLRPVVDYALLGVTTIHSAPCVEAVLEAMSIIVAPHHTLPHMLASFAAVSALVRMLRAHAKGEKPPPH